MVDDDSDDIETNCDDSCDNLYLDLICVLPLPSLWVIFVTASDNNEYLDILDNLLSFGSCTSINFVLK